MEASLSSPVLRVLTAVVVAALVAGVGGVASGSERDQLEQARARIARVAAEIDAARSDAAAAEAALAEADARLAEVESAVNEAAAAVERQEQQARTAEQRLTELREQGVELEARLADRAARLYKTGSGLPFELILASGDVDDALERSRFLRFITQADQVTLEEVTNSQVSVAAQRKLLEAELAELEEMRAAQEELLAEAERLRTSRALAAAAAEERVASLAAEKHELEKDEARIEALIEQRRRSVVSSTPPSVAGYAWPRCDTVTSEYGRRWGRMHKGIDIDGNTGDPIYASKAGVVIFAGWQGGYGRLTLIDHGDGVVTAYAHQSAQHVSDGARVDQGTHIGAVGNTGNSTGSHLHFETRVNGSAVDPRRFLSGGC